MFRTWGFLLRDAAKTVRAGGVKLLGLMLAFHLSVLLVALPVIAWLFREALRANGMVAVDFGALQVGPGLTLTITLLVLICLIAFWMVSIQLSLLVVVLHRARQGVPLTAQDVLTDLGSILRKLFRPSSFPLVLYLFVLLPLTGFGFISTFAQGIAIPSFITGELLKSESSAVALVLFFIVLIVLNVRLAPVVPIFALTDQTGGRAIRLAWRSTRKGNWVPLVLAVFTVTALASLVTSGLVVTAITPTVVSDEIAPSASPTLAAISLGIAQVIGMTLNAIVTALIAALLVAFLHRARSAHDFETRSPSVSRRPHISSRAAGYALGSVMTVWAIVLSVSSVETMERLSEHPDTLVIAHRGFHGGVENTLSSLDTAAAAGVDLVEMDVMQTKDGEFVAMHDANLSRLAGIDVALRDLTFEEATAVTVRDLDGNEDHIPSFADYVGHAAALELPLLVEIKLGGADTPDHVDRLVAELEELGLLENNIYHSLDRASVERLKLLRPDLTVGYTMAFAGVGLPETSADFIVVEEWTASDAMQRRAEESGLGFMVWTVNDSSSMRNLLRRNVEGIITDEADVTLDLRQQMSAETGLADTLLDALARFVVVM